MNEPSRAEEHLRVIRELMERATIYRAISAPTALVGGLLGVTIALAPAEFWASIAGRNFGFHFAWGAALFLTLLANTCFIARDAKRRGDPFLSSGMRMALRAVLPAMLTGGVFFCFFSGSALPPFLMLFYGLALLATSHFAPRSIALLGWAFLLAGCSTMIWSVTRGELGSGFHERAAMGATFGFFHLIYAACTWPRRGQ